ncbi:hypothetical protein [Kitasatospora sp. NPDC097643]|uniref:hypothetical protein n=1 Tax=Kitasatospora sp. NPDC097643 TaxID=3157230 RepID=UPI00333096D3
MTLWILDALVGLVTLTLEAGAGYLSIIVASLKRQANTGSGPAPGNRNGTVLTLALAATGTVGAAFWWVGLPVAAWIHFAAGGIVVLLALVALVADLSAKAWRRLRPPKPAARRR